MKLIKKNKSKRIVCLILSFVMINMLFSTKQIAKADWIEKEEGIQYENEEGERFQHHLTSQFFPAFDITPIGVNVGRRIYGIAEVNFGTDALIKLGIGGRF